MSVLLAAGMAVMACGYPAPLYPARVERIVDGDTAEMEISVGLGVEIQDNARLWGFNAPERYEQAGPAATAHLATLIPPGSDVLVELMGSDGRDKYGRPLVQVFTIDCVDVGLAMIEAGHAQAYMRDRR